MIGQLKLFARDVLMKIVMDTNVLFSFFKKDSFSRKLILNPFFELISPEIALVELNKYSKLIMKKCGLSKKEFDLCLENMRTVVRFVSKKSYSGFLKKAEKFCPDIGDYEFFALCLKENVFLWNNDLLLKEQDVVRVLSTKEILDLF